MEDLEAVTAGHEERLNTAETNIQGEEQAKLLIFLKLNSWSSVVEIDCVLYFQIWKQMFLWWRKELKIWRLSQLDMRKGLTLLRPIFKANVETHFFLKGHY